MKFKWHLIVGLSVSFILVQFFNFSWIAGLIVFLSSWLIDFDHYFWIGTESKNWNPIKAIKWRIRFVPKWRKLSYIERSKFKRGVFIFHGVEFWSIILTLSFFYSIFFFVLIGIGIHMILDWIELIEKKEPLYNKMLPFYVIKRNKNKKSLREL